MAAPPPPEIRFRANVNEFGKQLGSIVARLLKNNGFGGLGLDQTINEQLEKFNHSQPVQSLHTFVYYSYDHWQTILDKQISFFVEHSDKLLGPDYKEMVYPFVLICQEKLQTPGEEASLWNIIHNCIKSSLRYMLDNMNRGVKDADLVKVYFPCKPEVNEVKVKEKRIDVREWAKRFGMKV